MVIPSSLGFPRVGLRRELKKALEDFWAGRSDAAALEEASRGLRARHWALQKSLGLRHVPSNDFSLYDHVLDAAVMVDAVPERFAGEASALARYFAMARGSRGASALEMTKWFDTNYHYMVPEFRRDQKFRLGWNKPLEEYGEARSQGFLTRPVVLGPVSFLLSGKGEDGFDPLTLLDGLLPVYEDVLDKLADAGADWIQVDEPCLALDADARVRAAYERAYAALARPAPRRRILLTTYFGDLRENLDWAAKLPVAGLHLDLVRAPGQLDRALALLPKHLSLSLGLVDGRNVWRSDLDAAVSAAEKAAKALGRESVLVAPSCSLLHSPVDLSVEDGLDGELKGWMAFAVQKIEEVVLIARAVNDGRSSVADALRKNQEVLEGRRRSPRTANPVVRKRLAAATPEMGRRKSAFPARREAQQARLHLPAFPTTTIGSFPQTEEVRRARAEARSGRSAPEVYDAFLKEEIRKAVAFQEELGLDVLVHGEAERTDMVEYFGEKLEGFAFTKNGWVQSYGSRCVKPPVIFGDVSRPASMTVAWSAYAQSLTKRPMKGMLTGPVTILQWSFVRNDQPRELTCRQIGLALRDEVLDLEAAGLPVVQVDEPALREGLPLRRDEREAYLAWAVESFRLAVAGVRDDTQIHTHMCYAEFNEIIAAIAALDADVISLEASRSRMELLEAFRDFHYPNDVGPGVYDIHSPRIPTVAEMEDLLRNASSVVPPERLWVNPDCGLKTRRWEEVRPALERLVEAARRLRKKAAVPA